MAHQAHGAKMQENGGPCAAGAAFGGAGGAHGVDNIATVSTDIAKAGAASVIGGDPAFRRFH